MLKLSELPANLPQPVDDGACDHLVGMDVPDIDLPCIMAEDAALDMEPVPRIIIYCYPRSGEPGKPLPEGWDDIPGARGCTPQACDFRDHYKEMHKLGAQVFALSTQDSDYQQEFAERLHLPFGIFSDAELEFCDALRLPTFTVNKERLVKRLTLVLRDNKIEHVFYPIFPPDQHAAEVINWLKAHPL